MRFYHLHTNQRWKTKKNFQSMDSGGSLFSDQVEIGEVLSQYFSQLFSSSNLSDLEFSLQAVNHCVSDEMNQTLLVVFTEEEVKETLFMMKLMGAPSLDSFLACFDQKHWSIIRKEVSNFVIEVLNHRSSIECVNDTFITLILRLKDAQKFGDYRPISLCNVIFRLIAKVLTNRLKMIMPRIIYPNQSTFVPKKLINDNGGSISYLKAHLVYKPLARKAQKAQSGHNSSEELPQY